MNTTKINIDGEMVEVSLGIPKDEIETNEYVSDDTLDLTEVIKEIEQDNRNREIPEVN